MPLPSSPRFALAAALLGAGLIAAPAVHAFTLQGESGKVPVDDQSFLYPDRGSMAAGTGQTQGFKQEDGITTYKQGNTTFQFGRRRSFDEQYNTDHMFDPLGKPSGAR